MNRKDKKEALQGFAVLVAVVLVIAAFVWGANWLNDRSLAADCQGKFRTSECLKKMLKETEAKEEYQRKLKELQQ